MIESDLGEGKDLCDLDAHITFSSPLKDVRSGTLETGTWGQELMQRPWRNLLTGLLFRAHSACLSNPGPSAQAGITHNGLGPFRQSLMKKMLYRLVCILSLWPRILS